MPNVPEYEEHFSQTAIDNLRIREVTDSDMHQMLVFTITFGKTFEEAQAMLEEGAKQYICEHCGTDLSAREQRYRRRHINKCDTKPIRKSANDTTRSRSNAGASAIPSPPDSSASSSDTPPHPTPLPSPLPSPSRSPKRKRDDVDGPSSGNEESRGSREREDHATTPSPVSTTTKRPRLNKNDGTQVIRARASYKGQPGTIVINEDRTLLRWNPDNATVSKVKIQTSRITAEQAPVAEHATYMVQIFAQSQDQDEPTGYLFKFTEPEEWKFEASTIVLTLRAFARAYTAAQQEAEAAPPSSLTGRSELPQGTADPSKTSARQIEIAHVQSSKKDNAEQGGADEEDMSRFFLVDSEAEEDDEDELLIIDDESEKERETASEPLLEEGEAEENDELGEKLNAAFEEEEEAEENDELEEQLNAAFEEEEDGENMQGVGLGITVGTGSYEEDESEVSEEE